MSEKVRRGKEIWRVLLEEHADSGLSVAKFCELHELNSVTFYKWRQRLRSESQNGNLSSQVTSRGRPRSSKPTDQNGLIELIVGAGPAVAHTSAERPVCGPQRIVEVSLAGGVMVRVHGDISPTAIGQLVASIRASDRNGGH